MELEELADFYRGRTPDELRAEVDRLDGRLRLRHKDKAGKLRILTEGEQRQFDEDVAARDHAVQLIDQHEATRKGFRGGHYQVAYSDRGGDAEDYGDVLQMPAKQARSAALRVLDRSGKRLQADQKDRVEQLIRSQDEGDGDGEDEPLGYVARRLLLTENKHYRSAFKRLLTTPNGYSLLTTEEAAAMRAYRDFEDWESRAMGLGTPGAGYGVPVFIDPSIILTGQGSGNPFLQLARQVDVNTNIWKGVSSSGVSWSFDAEGSAVSDDAPAFLQPSIPVLMARGFLPYSIEVGMDYPSFADEMQVLLASGYDELLVDKFSRGAGTTEPLGVITALDADTNAEVRLTTSGAFGVEDVYRVWNALPQRYRRNASWMMTVTVNSAIRKFGNYLQLHAQTVQLPAGWAGEIMGHGVYDSPYFSDVVNTTGSFNQLVVGDFSQYVIPRRAGMSVELVPVLFDITANRPTGQRGLFAWARTGGGVSNTLGLRLLNQT